MLRTVSVAAAFVLLLFFGMSAAATASEFRIRVDGKILRKASEKLVLSFSSFEIGDRKEVWIENRKTGEKRTVPLSSIYRDLCYSAPLSPDVYEALEPDEWLPYIVWGIPDDLDSLRSRLSEVYEYQNMLRKELGMASLEEVGSTAKVSSRLTLNKLEKFHRIAAVIAAEYLDKARGRDKVNTFLHPLRIQVGFNPFANYTSPSRFFPARVVREAIYWEVHRILTHQFGIDEALVDFVFDSPSTERRFLAVGAVGPEDLAGFYPNVTLGGEAIDCAIYLQRQGFDKEVLQLVRLKMFRDAFITDRLLVDKQVNEGRVMDVFGDKAVVSFIPPFMKTGETVYVRVGEGGKEEVPVVLAAPVAEGGYTFSESLTEAQVARIRPGMPVRRK